MTMESIKLTNRYRDRIRDKLIENHFGDREKALREGYEQLALDIYDDAMGEDVRRMYDLPDGWLPEVEGVKAEIAGDVTVINFPDGVTKRMKNDKTSRWGGCEVIAKISARSAMAKRYDALQTEKAQLRAEISGVLHSVTTTKRLVEEWPEIEDVVRECCQLPAPCRLPAVRIDKLTQKLGLQQKAQEAGAVD